MQLNVINSRFIELIAGTHHDAWALAGDQLYLDLDLSIDAMPAGSRLAIGDRAVIEVTDQPPGCTQNSPPGSDATPTKSSGAGRASDCDCAASTPGCSSAQRSETGEPVRQLSAGPGQPDFEPFRAC
jgi:hypothetical protein